MNFRLGIRPRGLPDYLRRARILHDEDALEAANRLPSARVRLVHWDSALRLAVLQWRRWHGGDIAVLVLHGCEHIEYAPIENELDVGIRFTLSPGGEGAAPFRLQADRPFGGGITADCGSLTMYEAPEGAPAGLSLAENPFLDRATHGYFDQRGIRQRVSDLMSSAEHFHDLRVARCRYFGRFTSHDHLLADIEVREAGKEAHNWLALAMVRSFAWQERSDQDPRFDVRAADDDDFSIDIREGRGLPAFTAEAVVLSGTVAPHGEKTMPLPLDDPKACGRVAHLDRRTIWLAGGLPAELATATPLR